MQWSSHHHPTWPIIASWVVPTPVEVEQLDLNHPAVVEAASALPRQIR